MPSRAAPVAVEHAVAIRVLPAGRLEQRPGLRVMSWASASRSGGNPEQRRYRPIWHRAIGAEHGANDGRAIEGQRPACARGVARIGCGRVGSRGVARVEEQDSRATWTVPAPGAAYRPPRRGRHLARGGTTAASTSASPLRSMLRRASASPAERKTTRPMAGRPRKKLRSAASSMRLLPSERHPAVRAIADRVLYEGGALQASRVMPERRCAGRGWT